MKTIMTATRIYCVEQKADGTLHITDETGQPIKNAGGFILSMGGVERVLERCEELSVDEQKRKRDELKRLNIERKCALKEQYLSEERKYEEEYAALVADQPIEVTPHNLALLARHLNSENWGVWRLPELMVGYSAHQYDCDGKTATTITLDAPIMIGGELVTKLQYGAPRGHLRDYTPIAREL